MEICSFMISPCEIVGGLDDGAALLCPWRRAEVDAAGIADLHLFAQERSDRSRDDRNDFGRDFSLGRLGCGFANFGSIRGRRSDLLFESCYARIEVRAKACQFALEFLERCDCGFGEYGHVGSSPWSRAE
jgi:hypothetical protein